MDRPIPLSAATPFDGEGVEKVLHQAGMPYVVCPTWQRFRTEVPNTEVGVVVAPWLDQYPLTRIQDFTADHPWYPLLLLTERPAENLRLLARISVEAVLFLNAEEDRLPGLIRSTRGGALFLGLARRIRRDKELPKMLRVVLARILEDEPPAGPVEPSSPKAPPRSIRSLARRVRCSPDYLSRMARKHEIDLRGLLGWVVALRALQLRGNAEMTWERIAWSLGYESVSGLSEHIKSTLGKRPSELGKGDLGHWFQNMEERFGLAEDASRVARSMVGPSEGPVVETVGSSVFEK